VGNIKEDMSSREMGEDSKEGKKTDKKRKV
jgi:hypothetical protein